VRNCTRTCRRAAEDQGLIKLNTNENPYPPFAKVLAAVKAATDGRCAFIRTDGAVAGEKAGKVPRVPPENLWRATGRIITGAGETRAFVEPADREQFTEQGEGCQFFLAASLFALSRAGGRIQRRADESGGAGQKLRHPPAADLKKIPRRGISGGADVQSRRTAERAQRPGLFNGELEGTLPRASAECRAGRKRKRGFCGPGTIETGTENTRTFCGAHVLEGVFACVSSVGIFCVGIRN